MNDKDKQELERICMDLINNHGYNTHGTEDPYTSNREILSKGNIVVKVYIEKEEE